MKIFLLAPIALGLLFAILQPSDDSSVFILSGDMDGLLTPCGCTRPMSGGIRRLATAVKALSVPGRTVFLVNGGLVASTGRQDELKAEAFAQALKALHVTAIKVGASEMALGRGSLVSMSNIAGPILLGSPDARELSGGAVSRTIKNQDFLIGSGGKDSDIDSLVQAAKSEGLHPVLLLDGGADEASTVAAKFPDLVLIQFRSGGHASKRWVGRTLLASPGEKGKQVVRLVFRNNRFISYSATDLGPQYADDPNASRILKQYLSRVGSEHLADYSPRSDTPAYSGSATCGSCHTEALRVWEVSGHAHALRTLKKEGEHLDPECLKCHVVGFDSTKGYKDELKSRSLASVGCESCHGPGKTHSSSPYAVRLPAVTEHKCISCHTTEQSPNFQFSTFWPKIKHK